MKNNGKLSLKKRNSRCGRKSIESNDPVCVRITYDRLTGIGFSREKAKVMIAAVLVEEMYGILKNHERYNEESYCKKLSQLPEYYENKDWEQASEAAIDEEESGNEDYEYEDIQAEYEKQMPIMKEEKPGRNDPCPCGSGKKYKKCCGR